MYIETSSPRQPGDNAKLNTPDLQFGGNMCLKFYYHMYGASMGKLNVIINRNNVFTASGNKGNLWLKATVDVTLSGMYAVRRVNCLLAALIMFRKLHFSAFELSRTRFMSFKLNIVTQRVLSEI